MEETEKYYWEYRTTLTSEDGPSVWFVAEDIDYEFDILLNSVKLHSKKGIYAKVKLDLTNKAKNGDLLQVIIHPTPNGSCCPGSPSALLQTKVVSRRLLTVVTGTPAW